jgi:hypothetical protein
MEFALIIGPIAAIGALVIGIIYAVRKFEQARTEALQGVADELGLQFYPKGDGTVENEIGHLRLFNQGHSRKMKNMISGQTEDIEVAIFGYRYTTGGGKNQHTHQQTVISFRSPHLSLPEFEIRPENLFHKIGQALGYQDIDFDSHPIFSKKYLLRGPDEAAVREFLTPKLLQFFESQQGISVEASRDRLIYYRASKRIKPEQVRSFMAEGFHVYELMKQED